MSSRPMMLAARSRALAQLRRSPSVLRDASIGHLIDLERYPLAGPIAGTTLLAECHKQLDSQGFVCLPDFIWASAAEAITKEVLKLEENGAGFSSSEDHGIFLVREPLADDGLPERHPQKVQQQSSKLLFAADQLGSSSALATLYAWHPLLDFVRAALRRPHLHLSADPMGSFYANIFHVGDRLGWHFDNSEFSVSLVLQPASAGGSFEYAPDSRKTVEGMVAFPNDEDVADAIDVQTPPLQAGDLYLFHGRHSLHRVSPVVAGKRVNAILTYNTDPDEKMNEYTRLKFFGRSLNRLGFSPSGSASSNM